MIKGMRMCGKIWHYEQKYETVQCANIWGSVQNYENMYKKVWKKVESEFRKLAHLNVIPLIV